MLLVNQEDNCSNSNYAIFFKFSPLYSFKYIIIIITIVTIKFIQPKETS